MATRTPVRRISEPAAGSADDQMVCRLPDPPWSFSAWSERWFPDSYRRTAGEHRGEYTTEAAFAIARCHRCPFVVSCGAAEMKEEGDRPESQRHGIYGGMDPLDRYRLMVQQNGGVEPKNPNSRHPTEDAEPLRLVLQEARERYPSATALDFAVADAVGVSPDTIRMIRTGRRPRVRQSTACAVRGYFERGGR